MRKFVRGTICLVWILLLVVAPTQNLWSQETAGESRPVLVVSVASIDRLIGDIEYLTRTGGWPQIGGFLRLVTAPYLQDVDSKRPAGLLVTLNGAEPSGVAFLGTANFPGILAKIEEQLGKPQDMGGGLLKLSLQRDFFIQQQGNWVFVADQPAHLANVPTDPSQFLAGLDKQYTLAVRVNAGRIPPDLKEALVNQLKADTERRLAREMANQSTDEQQRAEQIAQQSLALLAALIADTDQVTLGWGTDSPGGKTFLETNLTAREGTKLASLMRKTAEMPIQFSGLARPDAAVSLAYNLAIPPQVLAVFLQAVSEVHEQSLRKIDNDPSVRDETAKAALKEAVGAFRDVLVASLERGQLNGGIVATTSPESLQVAAGAAVANGAQVEQALRKLAEGMGSQPGFPRVTFDVQAYQNTDLHSLSLAVPEKHAFARKLLGSALEVALGTSPDHVYLALGKDSLDSLRKVIDATRVPSSATGSPLAALVSVGPLLTLAQKLADDPAISAMSQAVSKSHGRDHLTLTARSLERGIVYRLEIEDGVLSLIGETVKLRGTGGGEP